MKSKDLLIEVKCKWGKISFKFKLKFSISHPSIAQHPWQFPVGTTFHEHCYWVYHLIFQIKNVNGKDLLQNQTPAKHEIMI